MSRAIIREIKTWRDPEGRQQLKVVFGPHFFFELIERPNGKLDCVLGATHHGMRADASEVAGEFESFLGRLSEAFPKNLVDDSLFGTD